MVLLRVSDLLFFVLCDRPRSNRSVAVQCLKIVHYYISDHVPTLDPESIMCSMYSRISANVMMISFIFR